MTKSNSTISNSDWSRIRRGWANANATRTSQQVIDDQTRVAKAGSN